MKVPLLRCFAGIIQKRRDAYHLYSKISVLETIGRGATASVPSVEKDAPHKFHWRHDNAAQRARAKNYNKTILKQA